MKRIVLTCLLALVFGGVAHATDLNKVKRGQSIDFSATACVTKDSGMAIVEGAKKDGTGHPAFLIQKSLGFCNHLNITAVLGETIATFSDTELGDIALVELSVEDNGHTLTFYGLYDAASIIDTSI